jgi:hypothetical protein
VSPWQPLTPEQEQEQAMMELEETIVKEHGGFLHIAPRKPGWA